MRGKGFESLTIVPSWGTYIRGSEPPQMLPSGREPEFASKSHYRLIVQGILRYAIKEISNLST